MRLPIFIYILLIRGFFIQKNKIFSISEFFVFFLGYYLTIEYFYYLDSGMQLKLAEV